RAAEADEHRRRFAALHGPFDQLLAKHAAMEERQRDYQEAWTSFAHLLDSLDSSVKPTAPGELRQPAATDTLASQSTIAVAEQVVAAAQSQQKSKRRFGIFPAV